MKQLEPASPVAGPVPDRSRTGPWTGPGLAPDRLRTGPGPAPQTGHQKFNFFNILQGE